MSNIVSMSTITRLRKKYGTESVKLVNTVKENELTYNVYDDCINHETLHVLTYK